MELIDLIGEITPYIVSIVASIITYKLSKKQKNVLSIEQIEEIAELKKQKYLKKLEKKNGVKHELKSEDVSQNVQTVDQINYTVIQ